MGQEVRFGAMAHTLQSGNMPPLRSALPGRATRVGAFASDQVRQLRGPALRADLRTRDVARHSPKISATSGTSVEGGASIGRTSRRRTPSRPGASGTLARLGGPAALPRSGA